MRDTRNQDDGISAGQHPRATFRAGQGVHGCVDDGGCASLRSAPHGRFFEEVAKRWVVDKGPDGHVSRMDQPYAAWTDLSPVRPIDSRKWQRSVGGQATTA